eukprot:4369468-Ditylum_brightwellii.AAC.1
MKKTQYVVKSNTKPVPLKQLVDELLVPQDIDSKESTFMIEVVGAIAIKAIIVELEDQTMAIHEYMTLSGSEYLYLYCPEEINGAIIRKMATNDLAESLFAGITTQTKEISKGIKGMFHTLPEELRLTAIIVSIEDAPATRESNSKALSLSNTNASMKKNNLQHRKAWRMHQMNILKL